MVSTLVKFLLGASVVGFIVYSYSKRLSISATWGFKCDGTPEAGTLSWTYYNMKPSTSWEAYLDDYPDPIAAQVSPTASSMGICNNTSALNGIHGENNAIPLAPGKHTLKIITQNGDTVATTFTVY